MRALLRRPAAAALRARSMSAAAHFLLLNLVGK
jgi:hypothetical protein